MNDQVRVAKPFNQSRPAAHSIDNPTGPLQPPSLIRCEIGLVSEVPACVPGNQVQVENWQAELPANQFCEG